MDTETSEVTYLASDGFEPPFLFLGLTPDAWRAWSTKTGKALPKGLDEAEAAHLALKAAR